MPHKQMDRNQERTILSLLPGKMVARRLLEAELEELRQAVGEGRNREYIALMPGLEMEVKRLRDELEMFAGATVDYNGRDASGVEAGESLRLSDGTKKEAAPVRLMKVVGNRPMVMGKPVVYVAVLWEFLHNDGLLVVDDFVKRWKYVYNLEGKRRTQVHASLMALRKRKLKIERTGNGVYRLWTQLTGELPDEWFRNVKWDSDTGGVEQPVLAQQEQVAPQEEQVAAQPVVGEGNQGRFEGTRKDILLQEFAAHENVIDMRELAKKYDAGNEYTFNWALGSLKEMGYKFTREGKGVFRLVSEPGKLVRKVGKGA